jgi:hypothetical protein
MLGRLHVDPTLRSPRKENAVIRFAKDNHHTYFPTWSGISLVFADSAGPNERGTQGYGHSIVCLMQKGEVIAGFLHRESKRRNESVRPRPPVRPVLLVRLWTPHCG